MLLNTMSGAYQTNTFGNIMPPCREIEKIQVEFKDLEDEDLKDDYYTNVIEKAFQGDLDTHEHWLGLRIYYHSAIYYKEIKEVKAYSTQSFIGNAGGYIGLLVGCTIIELPFFLHLPVSR